MSRNASRPQPAQGAPRAPQDLSSLESDIAALYTTYIISKSAPINELERGLHILFTSERFVSLRTDIPKGLNALGSQLLESSAKLWLLCIAIKLIKTPTMRSIFPLLKTAIGTVVNKRELIEGLDPILGIKDIEVNPEDMQNLDKLINADTVPAGPETIAVSECGRYALVRLAPALQKKLGWTFAVTPVEGNEWVSKEASQLRKPLTAIFIEANYAYHPGSAYRQ